MTQADLCDIGDKDVSRLRASIYKAAGKPMGPEPLSHLSPCLLIRGRGEAMPMTSGYEAFKAAYHAVEKEFKERLSGFLKLHNAEIGLRFHYCLDSQLNCFGDWAWHQYWVVVTEPEYSI